MSVPGFLKPEVKYLVTTNVEVVNKAAEDHCIAMVDGTVPNWIKGYYDLHFDHHRPGGGLVQIDEMPEPGTLSILQTASNININDHIYQLERSNCNWTIVTTLLDADACVAAAWLQLKAEDLQEDSKNQLRAIALDCDYLRIPDSESYLQYLSTFAAKVVAAQKITSRNVWEELGLPEDRKQWTEEQKILHDSTCFKYSTEWLIAAVKGERFYPGEMGEADEYIEELNQDIQALASFKSAYLIKGCAVLNQSSCYRYLDPRCLITLAKQLKATTPVTLTYTGRYYSVEGLLLPGYKYTLASSQIDLTKVFPLLTKAENNKRARLGLPPMDTEWGGRTAVGGSSWRDASLLLPEEVIQITLPADDNYDSVR